MRNLAKKADMPMFEDMGGDGGASGTQPRVQWKKFNAGQQSNLPQGGSIPPEITSRLGNKMKEFKVEFEEFAKNDNTGTILTKYRGMIFPYYATDFIGNDNPGMTEAMPSYLKETLNFVRENNVVLPSISQSGGKGIGSPYWISHYGYAYQDQAEQIGKKVEKGDRTRAREIRKVPAQLADRNQWPWGPYSIQETENGAGIFIDTSNSANSIGVVPVLDPNGNPKPRWRLFEGDLDPKSSASNVIIYDGPNGTNIKPAKRVNIGRMFEMDGRSAALDASGSPITKPGMNETQIRKAREAYELYEMRQNAIEDGNLYQMKLTEQGTVLLKNVHSEDDWYPMSSAQLSSILKDGWNSDLPEVAVVPERSSSNQETGQDAFGKFTMPEELSAKLSEEDGMAYYKLGQEGPQESNDRNPYSFESLRELSSLLSGGKVSINSFRLAVIGPMFSQARNLGEGQAVLSNPMMMSPQTSVDPMSNTLAVDRGVKWGLHITNHAPGRMKGVGDRGSNAWKSFTTDSIEEAFDLLQSEALKFDQNADVSAIGADAASIAQKALGKTVEMPGGQQQQPQLPIDNQVEAPNMLPPTVQPMGVDNINNTASVKKMMRRFSKK